jgi:hypothetical protein
MRITISVRAEQHERLLELCRELGISRGTAIRRAIARHLNEHRPEGRPERRPEDGEDVFGMWRGRPLDGLARERHLRNEWS